MQEWLQATELNGIDLACAKYFGVVLSELSRCTLISCQDFVGKPKLVEDKRLKLSKFELDRMTSIIIGYTGLLAHLRSTALRTGFLRSSPTRRKYTGEIWRNFYKLQNTSWPMGQISYLILTGMSASERAWFWIQKLFHPSIKQKMAKN